MHKLPKYILKYDYTNLIKAKPRNVREKGVEGYFIETSMNPILQERTANTKTKGHFSYPWINEGKPYDSYIIDFNTLFRNSTEIILFTYLKNINFSCGKIKVKKYPCPKCINEMEVAFKVNKNFEINGKKETNKDKIKQSVAWADTLDIAEKLLNKDLSEIDMLGKDNEIPNEVRKLMEDYDSKVLHIAEKLNDSIQ